MDKNTLHRYLLQEVHDREADLLKELEILREDVAGDTKSTAGDKHETGRAMNQLEQERILGQLQTVRSQLHTILKIDPTLVLQTVGFGAVVESTFGIFYISVGIGQLLVESTTVFCIGQDAPISQFLHGKKVGAYQWNGKSLNIQQIS